MKSAGFGFSSELGLRKPSTIFQLHGSLGKHRATRFGYESVSVGFGGSGKGKPLDFLELEPKKRLCSFDS
jgi:hypothetical protein